MHEHLRDKLAILPDQPGCYLMKDRHGTVIYVGKAKVLKNRVRSYFTGSSHDGKTIRLVSEIQDFEYIVTSSDIEALLLEVNLIKKYDPKYNIMLKDDKTYPFIKITAEKQPRLVITRTVKKDKGKYFGPYPHSQAAHETKKLLDRMYPLRKCVNMPNKVCLYYHMKQCLGPCVYEVTAEQNEEIIKKIANFLNGGYQETKEDLQAKMYEASEQLEFERAKEHRDQISYIEALMQKQKILSADLSNRDIFGYYVDKGWMCMQVFFVRQGKLIERDASIFPIFDEPAEEFLTFIGQFYEKNNIKPSEVVIPKAIDKDMVEQLLQVKVVQPQKGKKRELVQLAIKNAEIAIHEKFALIERDEERTIKAVENLGEKIGIPTPYRIEAFDNSNIQGVNPVSAMIVFIDGKPAKKEYRKYKIKTVTGPDDYESMREVMRRRYSRALKEQLPLPDLIIVDGGKGQIAVAEDVLQNELGLDVPVGGLVKDDKHRTSELLIGNPLEVIRLGYTSQEFYLLQRIQDEVHRFAITFHRQLRSKSLFQSVLDNIPGVGEKRKKALLQHFGSVKKIKEATVEEIKEAGIPQATAELIFERIHAEEKEES